MDGNFYWIFNELKNMARIGTGLAFKGGRTKQFTLEAMMMRSDYNESNEGNRVVPQAVSAVILMLAAMFLAFLVSSRAFAATPDTATPPTDRYAPQGTALAHVNTREQATSLFGGLQ